MWLPSSFACLSMVCFRACPLFSIARILAFPPHHSFCLHWACLAQQQCLGLLPSPTPYLLQMWLWRLWPGTPKFQGLQQDYWSTWPSPHIYPPWLACTGQGWGGCTIWGPTFCPVASVPSEVCPLTGNKDVDTSTPSQSASNSVTGNKDLGTSTPFGKG